MHRYLPYFYTLFLLMGCGSARSTEWTSSRRAMCTHSISTRCTEEYSAVTCTATVQVHGVSSVVDEPGANSCFGAAAVKERACEMGATEAEWEALTIHCGPQVTPL